MTRATDDPRPTLACPDQMGAMIVALDIDVSRLGHCWSQVLLQQAVARCTACATRDGCRQWLGGAERDPAGYRDFCPNAGLFDRFRGSLVDPD